MPAIPPVVDEDFKSKHFRDKSVQESAKDVAIGQVRKSLKKKWCGSYYKRRENKNYWEKNKNGAKNKKRREKLKNEWKSKKKTISSVSIFIFIIGKKVMENLIPTGHIKGKKYTWKQRVTYESCVNGCQSSDWEWQWGDNHRN